MDQNLPMSQKQSVSIRWMNFAKHSMLSISVFIDKPTLQAILNGFFA